jgi:hypothetical protein
MKGADNSQNEYQEKKGHLACREAGIVGNSAKGNSWLEKLQQDS